MSISEKSAVDRTLTIKQSELSAALRRWDEQAREEEWPERVDDERFDDNASYLFDLIEDGEA